MVAMCCIDFMVTPLAGLTGLVSGAAALSLLFSSGMPLAAADPGVETDGQGFVGSVARCTAPDTLLVFGNTSDARVAICRTPSGQFEYRGVRVSDGAKLVAPAVFRGGEYIAEDDGNLYTVTSRALTVSKGTQVISQESMVNFYQPGTGGADREKSPS
jgi:hypothetical protein